MTEFVVSFGKLFRAKLTKWLCDWLNAHSKHSLLTFFNVTAGKFARADRNNCWRSVCFVLFLIFVFGKVHSYNLSLELLYCDTIARNEVRFCVRFVADFTRSHVNFIK